MLTSLYRDFTKFSTTVDVYRGLLSKFENYVKLFQSEKPTLHILHAEMFGVVKKVASLFVKSVLIPDAIVANLFSSL